MTKSNKSFKVNKSCAQKGCKVAVQDGAKYCSQHITIDGDAAVAASTANTEQESTKSMFDSIKGFGVDVKDIITKFNKTCMAKGCKEHRVTGPGIAGYKPISMYCSEHRHMESPNTKEDKSMNTKSTTFKETASTAWAAIKRASMKALRYINSNRTLVAIGSTAISVAGLFTGSLSGALLVGAGIATLTVLAMHLIAKKKEQKLNYKALLNNLSIANGTVLAMPFVLLGLSYVLAFAFVYGAALPYAIIVA
ncbi:hypothetical protein C2I27_03890 [Priestia megaterium]|uniref:hypothetical protein n=1 Tax=Priestia megaterium TaxID=1404 RepID=UPI000D508216|nr:hypothetical protein [Priestia megaterium]PVC75038.1 hypothetical protein C2I27_03890 [Priestia megaterium]